MALPTSGLTLHLDASNPALWLFNLVPASPADGEEVAYWYSAPSSATVGLNTTFTGMRPFYRSTTPLMKNPCVDFDGSDDFLPMVTNPGNVAVPASTYITASAATYIVAFYAESITGTNNFIIGDAFGYQGMFLDNVSGQSHVVGQSYDGAGRFVSLAISTGRTYIAICTHSGGTIALTVIDDTGAETTATPVACGNVADINQQFTIGFGPSWGSVINGRIGELAVWNVALTGTPLSDAKDYFKTAWMTITGTPTAPPSARQSIGLAPWAIRRL